METIVKVQIAVEPPDAPALIYDRDRLHTVNQRLGKRDLQVMGGAIKVFRHAVWMPRQRKWKLGNRALGQEW